MIIKKGESWVPRSLTYSLGVPVVELALHSDPLPDFFSDLSLKNLSRIVRSPLMDIEFEDPTCNELAGILFHLPRSGSTLYARMLSLLPDSAVIIEPEVLNSLLSNSLAPGKTDPEWLPHLLKLYVNAFGKHQSQVFLKTSSWNLLFLTKFLAHANSSRTMVILREPLEVMQQVLDRPTGWMHAKARPFMLTEAAIDSPPASETEFVSRILYRFLLSVETNLQKVVVVNYRQDAARAVDEFCSSLNLSATPEVVRQLSAVASIDSDDWHGNQVYRPHDEAWRKKITPEVLSLVEKTLSPIYLRIQANLNQSVL